jgi:ribosomal-protein-alanine N-acetyltransferase
MPITRLVEPQMAHSCVQHSNAFISPPISVQREPAPEKAGRAPPSDICNSYGLVERESIGLKRRFARRGNWQAVLSSFSSIQCDAVVAQPYLSYEIRRVEASDASDVCAVEKASFNDPYTPEVLIDLMNRHQDHFFVASFHSKVVGYTVAFTNGTHGHIVSVAVDPEHRRRRIGSALLSALTAKLAKEGIEQIHLEVREGNAGAIAFYQRMGYRPSSKIRHYYADGEDALVLVRSAESSLSLPSRDGSH